MLISIEDCMAAETASGRSFPETCRAIDRWDEDLGQDQETLRVSAWCLPREFTVCSRRGARASSSLNRFKLGGKSIGSALYWKGVEAPPLC